MTQHNLHDLLRCGQHLELHLSLGLLFDVHHKVFRGLLHDAYFTIGHEVLHELFLLVRHQPREVGLVFCVDACHQFDVRTEDAPFLLPRGR